MKANANSRMRIIATLPPLAGHRAEIISHPMVDELRFNTIMPKGSESHYELLSRLVRECGSKHLWVDIKARQLRITKFGYLPYAYVELNHKIKVQLPAPIYFKDCEGKIVDIVDGNKLILDERPVRVVGDGEPVNILDPSLEILEFFAENDIKYMEAANDVGLSRYMVSFTEKPEDIAEVRKIAYDAKLVLKIESKRGMDFVKNDYKPETALNLMAARDDLFIQFRGEEPKIIKALGKILAADPDAIVASRIMTSLEEKESVAMGDICDLRLMRLLGFKTLMLSDTLCFRREIFHKAMRVLEAFFKEGL